MPNDDASAALDRGADPAEQVRLGPLIEPLEALRRGERPHAGEQASVREAIDTIMLGAPPRYGWRRFLELTGLDEHQTRDHRRALGFPYVGDDETPFTDHDVDSAQLMATFTGRG